MALNNNTFQALSDIEVLVLGSNGNLWLEHGPFGIFHQRDSRSTEMCSLPGPFRHGGSRARYNGNLWLEHGPFGKSHQRDSRSTEMR